MDAELARLALEQHGVVALGQLLDLGLSRGAIQHRIAAGRLHRVLRAVYAVGHPALAPEGRRMAAVLAGGPGAVLSHRSAAEAWNLLAGSTARWHVTTPTMSGGRSGPPSVVIHRTRRLTPADVTTLDGIPLTTPARTLVDLAGAVRPDALARAVHEAEVLRLLDVGAVAAALDRVPRRHGVVRLRRLLSPDVLPASSEPFVQAFLRLCRRHGLPAPQVSVQLQTPERLVEADIVFPHARVIVELDGEAVHRTRRNFHGDRRRDAALAAEGYLTVRYTWHRVTREAPTLAAELRRILAVRTGRV